MRIAARVVAGTEEYPACCIVVASCPCRNDGLCPPLETWVEHGNRCRKNNADMRLKHVRDKIVACTFLYTQEKLHISP